MDYVSAREFNFIRFPKRNQGGRACGSVSPLRGCPRTLFGACGALPRKKGILTCSARRLEEAVGEKMCVVAFDAEFMIE